VKDILDGKGEDGEGLLQVVWYYRPEEAVGGRKVGGGPRAALPQQGGQGGRRVSGAPRPQQRRARLGLALVAGRPAAPIATLGPPPSPVMAPRSCSCETTLTPLLAPPPPPLLSPPPPPQPFHGAKELFLSDHTDSCSVATVIGRCSVLTLQQYQVGRAGRAGRDLGGGGAAGGRRTWGMGEAPFQAAPRATPLARPQQRRRFPPLTLTNRLHPPKALPKVGDNDYYSRFTYRPASREFAPDRVPV
jgi:hypothetical protein